jgi:hypothetical protein
LVQVREDRLQVGFGVSEEPGERWSSEADALHTVEELGSGGDGTTKMICYRRAHHFVSEQMFVLICKIRTKQ